MPRSNVVYLEHESPRLRGNPLGNNPIRNIEVYLPPGYESDGRRRYPTIYILTGWSGSIADLQGGNAFSKPMAAHFDQLIHEKKMPPFIAVSPDLSTRLGGSQYVNSEANGPYMDVLCDEIVPLIDEKIRTQPSSNARGIIGHSSGGFGAMVTVMLRPGLFDYMVSSAGDSFYELLYVNVIPKVVEAVHTAGGIDPFLERFLSNPNPMALLKHDEVEAMMTLGICTCFLPNLQNKPLMADVYFDLKTGALIPDLWERFLKWDPLRMVDHHIDAMKRLKWICFQSGLQDEYGLHLGHRQISAKLTHHSIRHDIVEYPGKHGGHKYKYLERFQAMLGKMNL